MQQNSIGRGRKAALFGFATTAFVLALASTAFACVTFMGQMTVDGHDGDTTVVGTGDSHAYCSTGRPTTAAAGHLDDIVNLKVASATCGAKTHKLPAGSYEVRYNNRTSYTYDGTAWTMIPLSGCFLPANGPTTTKIGDFQVDGNGDGTWSGKISPIAGLPVYSLPGEASNLCVGDPEGVSGPDGKPGLLAPYQLLAI